MISAQIIQASVNPRGKWIVTWLLTYPRFIHAEFMTHRVFSRNAASSRAIPISKMIRDVINNPAVPEFWGANQKGMQAAHELTGLARSAAKLVWREARWFGVAGAWLLSKVGAHKQLANRLLEPWAHITVLATSTEHDNFFALRAHKDAQPEFQVLAYRMLAQFVACEPTPLDWGDWHIPFGTGSVRFSEDEEGREALSRELAVATARAARTSYATFSASRMEKDRQFIEDVGLHNRLADAGHWSPFEHSACASTQTDGHSNFKGWCQYRKAFAQENRKVVNFERLLAAAPDWIEL